MKKFKFGILKKKRVWIPAGVLVVILIAGGVVWGYHDNPQFCTTCHIMDPYLASYESPPLLANAHEEQGLICLDCHPFQISQSVKEVFTYISGNYEQPLIEREFDQEWCFECHEHGSWEEIRELTAYMVETVGRSPHDSHLGEMECRICHKMHKPSEDFCSQCHGSVTTEEGWISLEDTE